MEVGVSAYYHAVVTFSKPGVSSCLSLGLKVINHTMVHHEVIKGNLSGFTRNGYFIDSVCSEEAADSTSVDNGVDGGGSVDSGVKKKRKVDVWKSKIVQAVTTQLSSAEKNKLRQRKVSGKIRCDKYKKTVAVRKEKMTKKYAGLVEANKRREIVKDVIEE